MVQSPPRPVADDHRNRNLAEMRQRLQAQFPHVVFARPQLPQPVVDAAPRVAPPQRLAHIDVPIVNRHVHAPPQPPPQPREQFPPIVGPYNEQKTEELLSIFPRLDRKWAQDRSGYDLNELVEYITENEKDIPFTGNDRLFDVSMMEESPVQKKRRKTMDHHVDEAERTSKYLEMIVKKIVELENEAADKENKTKDLELLKKYLKATCRWTRANFIDKALTTTRDTLSGMLLISFVEHGGNRNTFLQHIGEDKENVAKLIDLPLWQPGDGRLATRRQIGNPSEDYKAGILDKWRKFLGDMMAKVSVSVQFTCGICFEDNNITKSICCVELKAGEKESHRYCHECVQGQAQAACEDAKLAEGGIGLRCAEPSCEGVLQRAEVLSILDKASQRRLAKRMDDEALRAISDVECCKYCSFAMQMDQSVDVNKVFSCLKCKAQFCRLCKRDWTHHIGRKCNEMPDFEQDEARKKLEEQMTMAVLRVCSSCKLGFEKIEGCNKMTCRCGMTSCYVCRETRIDYKHFCNHVADPDRPGICPQNCNKCRLWIQPQAKDEQARVEAVRQRALNDELTAAAAARLG